MKKNASFRPSPLKISTTNTKKVWQKLQPYLRKKHKTRVCRGERESYAKVFLKTEFGKAPPPNSVFFNQLKPLKQEKKFKFPPPRKRGGSLNAF